MESDRCLVNATLEFTIKDFCTATEKLYKFHRQHDDEYDISFDASVFPNGVDEETKGWVVVLSGLNGEQKGIDLKTTRLQWTVSIIDTEGSLRFPQSFERDPSIDYVNDVKYFQKSFILDRQDELLSDGVLRLRCDICFDFKRKKKVYMWDVKGELPDDYVSLIFGYNPPAACSKSGYEPGFYEAFRFTPEIIRPKKFHDSGIKSGVYLIASGSSLPGSESAEISFKDKEDTWIIDTYPDRFLLSLGERQDNLGARLVEASPVIRKCISSNMKENREKRIELLNVESKTFRNVLYLLESGKLLNRELDEIVEVYKFSHLYEMEYQRQKCAEYIVEWIKTDIDFDEAEKIADMYTDEYFSTLLDSIRHKYGKWTTSEMNDTPDYNYYI